MMRCNAIERIKRLGGIPAVGVKQTQRKGVSNNLRKESLEEWERCKKKRYRVEALFGAIKLKVGCGLNFVNEDMARKSALAVAVLWSLYMLATLLLFILCVLVVHLSLRGSLIHRVF